MPDKNNNLILKSLKSLLVLMFLLVSFFIAMPNPTHGEYADIILNERSQKAGMRPVIFSHWFHRIRYRCKVCHTELGFKIKITENNISMSDLFEGRFCGACHNNETAWGLENCMLCHSGRMGLSTGIIQDPEPGGPR